MKINSVQNIQNCLLKIKNAQIAFKQKQFFKTKKGEYAEHDKFLGIRMPDLHRIAQKGHHLTFDEIQILIRSKWHEFRMLALLILRNQYVRSSQRKQNQIYNFYVNNFQYVNNWDLVDSSAPYIVGRHLMNQNRRVLYDWLKSENVWIRRIAMVTNWWFIRKNDLKEIFSMAYQCLNDKHDLMQKATGWMLREAGKKNQHLLLKFLNQYANQMPRITLRYALEKIEFSKRKKIFN